MDHNEQREEAQRQPQRGIADRGKTPGASRILVARYAKGRAPARAKKGPKKSEDSERRPAT